MPPPHLRRLPFRRSAGVPCMTLCRLPVGAGISVVRSAGARLSVGVCASLLAPSHPRASVAMALKAAPDGIGGAAAPRDGLWNLPNVLTMSRVAMVPVMAALMFWSHPHRNLACAGLFLAAAVTDFFDGYLARRWKITSPFGAFLDPVADKLMVAAVMIQLGARAAAAGWQLEGACVVFCCIITLCREIAVSALREWMASQGARATVQVGWLGKCKTACQMVALTLLLLAMPPAPFLGPTQLALVNRAGLGLLYASTWLALSSAWQYFRAAWPVLSGRAGAAKGE